MKVGLFIPCYINAVYPEVGRASCELLRRVGCDVDYPLDQTCCGQPMANAGFERDAKALAERMNALFERYDYVVGPSGQLRGLRPRRLPTPARQLPRACLSRLPHLGDLRISPRRGETRTARRPLPAPRQPAQLLPRRAHDGALVAERTPCPLPLETPRPARHGR